MRKPAGTKETSPGRGWRCERAPSHEAKPQSIPPAREAAGLGGKCTAGDKGRKLIFKHPDKEQMT